MTAPTPEKAAPIPADVLATARNSVADQAAKEGAPGALVRRIRDGGKDDWLVPTAVAAILADRASQEERDREARPSLPDSREERIREDERDRLYADAPYEVQRYLDDFDAMFPNERDDARAKEGR